MLKIKTTTLAFIICFSIHNTQASAGFSDQIVSAYERMTNLFNPWKNTDSTDNARKIEDPAEAQMYAEMFIAQNNLPPPESIRLNQSGNIVIKWETADQATFNHINNLNPQVFRNHVSPCMWGDCVYPLNEMKIKITLNPSAQYLSPSFPWIDRDDPCYFLRQDLVNIPIEEFGLIPISF